MQILMLESFDAGSHRAWLRGYQRFSTHQVDLLTMPGQFWKWRMQGGAVTLARQFMASDLTPDLIVASDMLDLTTFLAVTRTRTAGIPAVVYFHENQLTYPLGTRQRREIHFQLSFINYISALAADAVYFNSPFHRTAFFEALPRLLKHYPEYNELDSIPALEAKARVLPLGLDLQRFDAFGPHEPRTGPPLIVWNHRWDYDKNPQPFLDALVRLADEDVAFTVALTGENTRQKPEEFEVARELLGDRVVQYGYAEAFADYARLLWAGDVQVSTAQHDFFGISTCEAIYCGCFPLLPQRLNYPDLIPTDHHARHLYQDGEIYYRLRDYLATPARSDPALRRYVSQFDWSIQAPIYDEVFGALR